MFQTKLQRILLASVALGGLATVAMAGAEARAGAGSTWVRPTGFHESQWYYTAAGAATARIEWYYGRDVADGVPLERAHYGDEWKFGASPLGPVGITWTGFDAGWGPGPLGSEATNRGIGSSTVTPVIPAPPLPPFNIYSAHWTCIARGTVGAGAGAFYESRTDGKDPWQIRLPDPPEPYPDWDILFPVEIDDGTSSKGETPTAQSHTEFAVDLTGPVGVIPILHIAMSGQVVTVESLFSGAHFYAMTSINTIPNPIQSLELTPLQLRDLLISSIDASGTLQNALSFGVLLEGMSQSSLTMPDGSPAEVSMTAVAYSEGLVPTPSPVLVGLLAMQPLMLRRRRAKTWRRLWLCEAESSRAYPSVEMSVAVTSPRIQPG